MRLDKKCKAVVLAIGEEGKKTIAQIASGAGLDINTVYHLLKVMPNKVLFQPSGNNPQGLPTYSCTEEGVKVLREDNVCV